MKSINKIIIIGNVGHQPEVRALPDGTRVASFSVATSEQWTDGKGEKKERKQWHRCIAWNTKGRDSGLADIAAQYVRKGDRIYIEGAVEYREYEDKDGATKYTTEIKVRDIVLLGGRSERVAATPARKERPPLPLDGKPDFSDFPSALDDDEDDLPF